MTWTWLNAAEELLSTEVERTLRFLDEFESSQAPERKAIDSAAAENPGDVEFMEALSEDLYELANTKRIAHVAVLLKAFSIVEATVKNAQKHVWGAVEDAQRDKIKAVPAAPAAAPVVPPIPPAPPAPTLYSVTKEAFKIVRRVGEREEAIMKRGSIGPVIEELGRYTNAVGAAINLKAPPSYSKVNDIRILNNAFKHGGGAFTFSGPDDLSKDQNRILTICGESNTPGGIRIFHIPYENLDVRDFLNAAKDFASYTHIQLHGFLSKPPISFK